MGIKWLYFYVNYIRDSTFSFLYLPYRVYGIQLQKRNELGVYVGINSFFLLSGQVQ